MIPLKSLEILKKYKITPNPAVDQHFMVDEMVLKKIVSAAKIKRTDVVLEIGAGIGNLTILLAEKAKKVYAVEKDATLYSALKSETNGFSNIEIITADALQIKLPRFDKLVSNLPYQICEAFLQKLFFLDFKSALLCVPASFAGKLRAKEGEPDFSKLSIIAQAFFDMEIIEAVAKPGFYPEPRTESVLIKLHPKRHPVFSDYFLQEVFRQRDRKLKNALREALIFASKNSGKEFCTKRAARAIIGSWKISSALLDKRAAELHTVEITKLKAYACIRAYK